MFLKYTNQQKLIRTFLILAVLVLSGSISNSFAQGNTPPWGLVITDSTVVENSGGPVVVGQFGTLDVDPGQTHIYSLVEPVEASKRRTLVEYDNELFSISGNLLLTTGSLDYEEKSELLIFVQTQDNLGGTFSREVTILVTDVNDAPSDLSLSNSDIDENSGANAAVGTFSTEDDDEGDSHKYTFTIFADDAKNLSRGVATPGNDNSSFDLDTTSGALTAKASFNYESDDSYFIQVRTTDDGNPALYREESFEISVNNVWETPTNLTLSANSIDENAGDHVFIGKLTTTDQDEQSHTYSIQEYMDGSDFEISNDSLFASSSLNYEDDDTLDIKVRTTDVVSMAASAKINSTNVVAPYLDKEFKIVINDLNDTPSDISLSNSSINENNSVGDVVGVFSTTDEDQSDSHDYSFDEPEGASAKRGVSVVYDHDKFTLSDDTLKAAVSFNYESDNSYLIRVETDDDNDGTRTEDFTITINNVAETPLISGLPVANLGYTENDEPTQVTDSITVSDPDIPPTGAAASVSSSKDRDANSDPVYFYYATIQISSAYKSSEDTLMYNPTVGPKLSETQNGFGTSWDDESGTLTLTGSASAASYETAFKNIYYYNSSDDPSIFQRTVTFIISDESFDDGANSDVKENMRKAKLLSEGVSRLIDITAVNDAPVVSAIESDTLAYEEFDGAVATTSSIMLTDDNDDLESAAVMFGSGYVEGEDSLAFTTQNGITGVWTSATGTLVLSGTATVGNYQTALRSIAYVNSTANPTESVRRVDYQVYDGLLNSTDEISRFIEVFDTENAPGIAGIEGANLVFTENDDPVQVTSSVTISDSDEGNIYWASIQIAPYFPGEDVLSYEVPARDGKLHNSLGGYDPIEGVFNAETGELLLSGTNNLENYEYALTYVMYQNVSEAPNVDDRSVTIKVGDESLESKANFNRNNGRLVKLESNQLSRTIKVVAVNDAPVLSLNTGLNVPPGTSKAIALTNLLTTDADNSDQTLIYTVVSAPVSGTLSNNGSLLATGDTFWQLDISEGDIVFENTDISVTEDSFLFDVKDANGASIGETTFALHITSSGLLPPTNLSVVFNNEGNAVLTWTDNSENEDGFNVERLTNSANSSIKGSMTFSYEVVATVPANTTEYTDATTAEGVSYSYRISAFNSEGSSGIAGGESGGATVSDAPLNRPTELAALLNDNNFVGLSWEDNSTLETGYLVERKEGEGAWAELTTLGANSTSYVDETAVGGMYSYRVKAVNSTHESNFSDEVEITINVTGIDDWASELPTEFELKQNYPNPFNPTTTIAFGLPTESHVRVVIYNILGQRVRMIINQVMSAGYHLHSFDAQGLNSGIYIYRIEASDFVSTKKMLLLK